MCDEMRCLWLTDLTAKVKSVESVGAGSGIFVWPQDVGLGAVACGWIQIVMLTENQ